jgi:hypothetical protein
MREYACKLWHILLEGGKERNVRQKDGKNGATYSTIIIACVWLGGEKIFSSL